MAKAQTKRSMNAGRRSAAEVGDQLGAQNRELMVKCAEARDALATAERNDVSARYKVGKIVAEVMDQARYGESGVAKMEAELGLHRQALYRYACVAGAWTPSEFKKVSSSRNVKGLPLTWSHFEVLAKVADPAARDLAVDRALSGSLAVRDLSKLLRAAKQPTEAPAEPGPITGSEVARNLIEWVGDFQKEILGWDQRLVSDLSQAKDQLSAQELNELRDAAMRMATAASSMMKTAQALNHILNPSELHADDAGAGRAQG